MDSDRERRFDIDQSVRLSELGVPGELCAARIVNISAHGIRLLSDYEIETDAAIKVEWGRTTLLGRSVYCLPEGDRYSIWMELDEAVYDSQDVVTKSGQGLRDISSDPS
jgi:hypothetical protein